MNKFLKCLGITVAAVLIYHVLIIGVASFIEWDNFYIMSIGGWDKDLRLCYGVLALLVASYTFMIASTLL